MTSTEHSLPSSLFMDMDRGGPIPLYYQVASRIEKAIADGTLAVGSRIDNEVALGERLGISRPTIRRAFQELVDKGLVVRRRGIGTQVVQGNVTRNVELTSLFEDLVASDRQPETRILTLETVAASALVADQLAVAEGSPILHMRRVRLADAVPLALLENFLPVDFADLAAPDLEKHGLYQLLRARGVAIKVARQRIGARSSSSAETKALGLEKHSALLTMDRVAFDNSGRAVEFGHHVYRPDLYSFEVTLVEK